MAHDKPKVTIDLEEYECLKREAAEAKGQSNNPDVSAYKKVIFEILKRVNFMRFIEEMSEQGIIVSCLEDSNHQLYGGWETVGVKYIKKI